jgi:hypothetical protein
MRASLLANSVRVRQRVSLPVLRNDTYFGTYAEFGVSCAYGGKAIGLTFAGESSFDLNESFASSPHLPSERTVVGDESSKLSDCQRPSLSTTIVAHCNGLPSPPDSDVEELGYNPMLGLAALEVMNRFNERTVLSVGTRQAAQVYQKEVFRLACSVSGSTLPIRHKRSSDCAIVFLLEKYCHNSDTIARSPSLRDACHQPYYSVALVRWHGKVQGDSYAAAQKRHSGCFVGKCSSSRRHPICQHRRTISRRSLATET